ncbi:predicted protein [Naegleria gruberi]|uniref:Predicted protein n=1 Tax=Naegleria gruberi TaxID=5762 RepID=D2W3R0_NAEGR|nr:mRNA export factor mex67 [Naegleria gruberi]XP_002669024.1 uncharacterized protein NAEGRDRAFT_76035 [Naegleria gruberi]EFC36000.1 mRNA export factor mex67 [Naegleria gruberi]EFC36280.1 predicted protein [Naegleria gruberi]|eukprot:XP_002668744.1 mRNA export factor mex67 [Naegleria gruberi strain NEG-M]
MLRFANPIITISTPSNSRTNPVIQLAPGSTLSNNQPQISNEQIAMINALGNYTGESEEKCLRYLIFFGWNFELAYKATVLLSQELCERTKLSNLFLARRILEEAQFDVTLCHQRMELVLYLMNRTNLVHVFAYDCLQQYQWNINSALQRVFELASMNRLPSHAFSTIPNLQVQQQSNNNQPDSARSLLALQTAYHNQSRHNLFKL